MSVRYRAARVAGDPPSQITSPPILTPLSLTRCARYTRETWRLLRSSTKCPDTASRLPVVPSTVANESENPYRGQEDLPAQYKPVGLHRVEAIAARFMPCRYEVSHPRRFPKPVTTSHMNWDVHLVWGTEVQRVTFGTSGRSIIFIRRSINFFGFLTSRLF